MNKILLSVCLAVSTFYTMNSAYAIDAKYRAKLERSGCTQVSELQGCDVNKSKAENSKAGFGTDKRIISNTYAGKWIAKNSNSEQTVSNILDGGLIFKKGFISYKLEGDPTQQDKSYWTDSDAKTSGPIVRK